MPDLEDINLKVSVEAIGDIAAGIGLERLAEQVLQFGQDVVEAGINAAAGLENTQIAFEAAFGEQGAGIALTAMNDLSYATFSTNDQLNQLALRLKNAGVEIGASNTFLKEASDIAAASSTSFQGMNNVLEMLSNTYSLALSRGSVNVLYLRRLAKDVPGIYQAIADVMNKSGKGIVFTSDMIVKGGKNMKITADTYKKAIESLGMSEKYLGKSKDQAESFTGTTKNLNAKLLDIGRTIVGMNDKGEILKGGFFDKLLKAAQDLYGYLKDHEKDFETLGKSLEQGLGWIAKNKDLIIAGIIGISGAIIISALPALYGLVVAFGALTVAALPWLVIAGGIALIAKLIMDNWEPLVNLFKGIWEWITKAAMAIKDFITGSTGIEPVMAALKIPEVSPGQNVFTAPGGLGSKLYGPGVMSGGANNSRSTNITMHNNVNSPGDWTSIAKEIGWQINQR